MSERSDGNDESAGVDACARYLGSKPHHGPSPRARRASAWKIAAGSSRGSVASARASSRSTAIVRIVVAVASGSPNRRARNGNGAITSSADGSTCHSYNTRHTSAACTRTRIPRSHCPEDCQLDRPRSLLTRDTSTSPRCRRRATPRQILTNEAKTLAALTKDSGLQIAGRDSARAAATLSEVCFSTRS